VPGPAQSRLAARFLVSVVVVFALLLNSCDVEVVPPPDDCAANPVFSIFVEVSAQDGVTSDWTDFVDYWLNKTVIGTQPDYYSTDGCGPYYNNVDNQGKKRECPIHS
jgi:hypothetical protein